MSVILLAILLDFSDVDSVTVFIFIPLSSHVSCSMSSATQVMQVQCYFCEEKLYDYLSAAKCI
jgi:hypothetical protein